MLPALEYYFRKRGYVRCPNHPTRWYAAGPGIVEPINADVHIVYSPEHAPEGRIVIVPLFAPDPVWPYLGAIVTYRDVFEYDLWLQDNSRLSKSGQSNNSWD